MQKFLRAKVTFREKLSLVQNLPYVLKCLRAKMSLLEKCLRAILSARAFLTPTRETDIIKNQMKYQHFRISICLQASYFHYL